MNLRSKTGSRFCADATGTNAAKGAGGKFKAAPDNVRIPMESARQIARELVTPLATIRLAAVDKIGKNLKALAYVYKQTNYGDVKSKIHQILEAAVLKDPEQAVMQSLDAVKIVATVGKGLSPAGYAAVIELGKEVVGCSILEDEETFVLVAVYCNPPACETAILRLIDRFRAGTTSEETLADVYLRVSHSKEIARELATKLETTLSLRVLGCITGSFPNTSEIFKRAVERARILYEYGTDFERGLEKTLV